MVGDQHDMRDSGRNHLQQVPPTGRHGAVYLNDRRSTDGIFPVLPAGSPWRDLPERDVPYIDCHNRYNRWSKIGDEAVILKRLQGPVNRNDNRHGNGVNSRPAQWMDSSAVRARRHAAGPLPDGKSPRLGRSRRGLSTKIQALASRILSTHSGPLVQDSFGDGSDWARDRPVLFREPSCRAG